MKKVFKDLELEVPEEVYEPREDSFILAESLEEMNLKGKKVLDLCTGSGIQALVAGKEAEKVVGVDINKKALKAAERNAELNNIENIEFLESDLFEEVEGKFDVIVMNPPYLPEEGFEERKDLAWSGGEEGREVIDRFISKSPEHLREEGILLLVQSSVSSIDTTLEKLHSNFKAKIIEDKKVPWEKLAVIKAFKK